MPANGTWWYENSDGTLLHFSRAASVYGSYCVNTGSACYNIYSRVVPTEGDLLTSNASGLSFTVSINTATGSFSRLQYGSLPYTVN